MQLEVENFELLQQQRLKLISTCMDWTPTHSPLLGADSLETVEHKDQLKRWKVSDFVAIPQGWTGRSVVLRHFPTQNFTDRWPILTVLRVKKRQPTKDFLDSADRRMETDLSDALRSFRKDHCVEHGDSGMDAAGEIHREDLSKQVHRRGMNGHTKIKRTLRGRETVAKEIGRISEKKKKNTPGGSEVATERKNG